jgi:hypothetical protein
VTERSTIRLHPPVILWWVWVAFVLLNVVDYALQGLPSARFGAVLASLLLLVTALVYTLALRPRVIEDGEALTVVNPFRVHRLPWPRIQSVETGEWVRVRYTRGGLDGSSGTGAVVSCWALYVSTRARRKVAVGAAPPRADGMSRRLRGLAAQPSGYPQPSAKLPDEARYLASLPVSAAIAARLNTRASRERARAVAHAPAAPSVAGEATATHEASVATTTWSWPALAVVAVPALILLALALV